MESERLIILALVYSRVRPILRFSGAWKSCEIPGEENVEPSRRGIYIFIYLYVYTCHQCRAEFYAYDNPWMDGSLREY